MKKSELLRAVKFTAFSLSAGVIEMGVFALLTGFTSWNYWGCYLTALVLSVLWNFTLNRKFTFQSAANVPVAMVKVVVFYAIFTPVSTLLGNYIAENLGWNEFLVTVLNMIANFLLEYLYDRYFVFRDSLDTGKET